MQKVVGSNPISRLKTLAIAGVFLFAEADHRLTRHIPVNRLESGAQRYGGGTPRDSVAFTPSPSRRKGGAAHGARRAVQPVERRAATCAAAAGLGRRVGTDKSQGATAGHLPVTLTVHELPGPLAPARMSPSLMESDPNGVIRRPIRCDRPPSRSILGKLSNDEVKRQLEG
jgi:hypothetical protein